MRLACKVVSVLMPTTMTIAPAHATEEPVPDDPSVEMVTQMYYSPLVDEWVVIDGQETVETLAPKTSNLDNSQTANASGCTITTFMGQPRRVQKSSYPYTVWALNSGSRKLSSGCSNRSGFSMTLYRSILWDIQWVKKDSDSDDAYPGGATQWVEVAEVCPSGTKKYFTSSYHLQGTSLKKNLCP